MTEIIDILKLTVVEWLHLVQTIWDNITDETEGADIEDDHKAILIGRLEFYNNNLDDNISWEEVDKNVKINP